MGKGQLGWDVAERIGIVAATTANDFTAVALASLQDEFMVNLPYACTQGRKLGVNYWTIPVFSPLAPYAPLPLQSC